MSKPPKIVRWIGSSRQELQELPKAVRQFVGQALWEAQQGKMPEDGKVLQGFGGANVVEIRANDIGGTIEPSTRYGFAILFMFCWYSRRNPPRPSRLLATSWSWFARD